VAAAYNFTAGPAGALGTGAAPAELARPAAYLHGIFPELLTRHRRSAGDFAFNFGVFALMGILLAAWGGGRSRAHGRDALAAAFLVVGAATGLESLQFYVDGRTSSMRDLAAAVAGGLTGFLLLRSTLRATDPER
jgi:VanZ family protein